MAKCDSDRAKFFHPYDPYDIQLDFMKALYETIDGKKIGLFESPTGTGKTLSLICGSMTWLRDHKKNSLCDIVDDLEDDNDDPEWVKQSYLESKKSDTQTALIDYENHLTHLERAEEIQLQGNTVASSFRRDKKRFKYNTTGPSNPEDDEDYLLDDYYSDDENDKGTENSKNGNISQEVLFLLQALDTPKDSSTTKIDSLDNGHLKIYFASRTHSQLSQFSGQLRLTSFPPTFSEIENERTKFLPLGSRKQLCINSKVAKLKDAMLMNDACLDLQNKDSGDKSCPYFPKMYDNTSQDNIIKFRDKTFMKVHDIEDLTTIGKELTICPYYSVRSGISTAEIITLPYQLLLTKSARTALNIDLKSSIIIIDEAHNLLDTISSLNSSSVSLSNLLDIDTALKHYMQKFWKKFNNNNRIYLSQLKKFIKLLKSFIKARVDAQNTAPGTEITANDIFQGSTADLVNIHKLEKYMEKSKIAFKLERYSEKLKKIKQIKDNPNDHIINSPKNSSLPLLFKISAFLHALSNPSSEGKIFFDNSGQNISLQYMLLDPSFVFREIIEEARCVILAGGTMEPVNDYMRYLFPYIPSNQIKRFRCGHIIPKDNLKVIPIGRGSSDLELEFSFAKRNSKEMIDELGKSLIILCRKIHNGAVVFFPSYKYLNQVVSRWKVTAIWDDLNKVKPVFMEPQGSEKLSQVLTQYSEKASSSMNDNQGALLLSVVGGKMSEGINFSDTLARAVIMIGLPFSNAFSGELIAKRKFVETSVLKSGGTQTDAKNASRDYYENICMRAVNQSVGRAIRHKNDYAVVILMDDRFGKSYIQNKLSLWIREKIVTKNDCTSFSEGVRQIDTFFRDRKEYYQRGCIDWVKKPYLVDWSRVNTSSRH